MFVSGKRRKIGPLILRTFEERETVMAQSVVADLGALSGGVIPKRLLESYAVSIFSNLSCIVCFLRKFSKNRICHIPACFLSNETEDEGFHGCYSLQLTKINF